MSEALKRNSTRERKTPKFLQNSVLFFIFRISIFGASDFTESQKQGKAWLTQDNRSSIQEITQIAKLLAKFSSNATKVPFISFRKQGVREGSGSLKGQEPELAEGRL